MGYLYHTFLYQPILNLLVFLFQIIPPNDLGVAIITLTAVMQAILYPVMKKNIRTQLVMQKIQPELKKLQDRNKDDSTKQYEEMMALYREHGINPFGGFLLIFVQLILIIPLYQVFLNIYSPEIIKDIYGFLPHLAAFPTTAFGLLNLGQPSMLLVALAALAQFAQGWLTFNRAAGAGPGGSNKFMVFIGPVITLTVFYRLPAAVSLYWVTTSIISAAETALIYKQLHHGKSGKIRETTG